MKETEPVDLLGMSLKLYEVHKTMKAFYGPAFEGHVRELTPMLLLLAESKDSNIIAGAIASVKSCKDGQTAALILAVAVELATRQNAAQTGSS
jgi:hypothetical protein